MKDIKRLKSLVNRKQVGLSSLSFAVFLCVFFSSLLAFKSPAFCDVPVSGKLTSGIQRRSDVPLKIAEGETLSTSVATCGVRVFKDGHISKSVLWNQSALSDSKELHGHFDSKAFSFFSSFYFNFSNKSPPVTILL